ncbi:DUF6876 family protein [Leeuwenhoekiella palythoae]|uniref:DUF6876 family protein n=1 Tax=Leeuwenhoekiella palythoae TaxID=573501 RepID=UPI00351423B4
MKSVQNIQTEAEPKTLKTKKGNAQDNISKSFFKDINANCRNPKSVQERTHKEAKITYADGNGTILLEQEYEYTDFPLDELRLFFVDDMLMLPNEY